MELAKLRLAAARGAARLATAMAERWRNMASAIGPEAERRGYVWGGRRALKVERATTRMRMLGVKRRDLPRS
jgi:hypothetical protein